MANQKKKPFGGGCLSLLGASPLAPTDQPPPFSSRLSRCSHLDCRAAASARIRLASTVKPSPPTSPSAMHRDTVISNSLRKRSLSPSARAASLKRSSDREPRYRTPSAEPAIRQLQAHPFAPPPPQTTPPDITYNPPPDHQH